QRDLRLVLVVPEYAPGEVGPRRLGLALEDVGVRGDGPFGRDRLRPPGPAGQRARDQPEPVPLGAFHAIDVVYLVAGDDPLADAERRIGCAEDHPRADLRLGIRRALLPPG